MKSLVLDKKKYVVVAQKEYDKLIEKAAAKTPSARKMSLLQSKKNMLTNLLINGAVENKFYLKLSLT